MTKIKMLKRPKLTMLKPTMRILGTYLEEMQRREKEKKDANAQAANKR